MREPRHRLRRVATHRPEHGRGFTLVELVVGLTVASILLLALYQVFESNTALARTQTDVADMQQSLRIAQTEMARLVRMAGRGGLQEFALDGGVLLTPAIEVRDNAATGGDPLPAEIAPGFADSPQLVPGTDVLTVRGVFNSPLYQVNNANPAAYTLFDAAGLPTTEAQQAVRGQIVVTDPSPAGIPQDLTPLIDVIDSGAVPEALILSSPVDESIYGIVELDSGSSSYGPGQVTLVFEIQGGEHTDAYRSLYASGGGAAPVLPAALSAASQVGIVEEYRFYVRDGLPNPTLSMARMLPGTQTPYPTSPAESRLDIADNVLDLQIALGFDSNLGDPLVDRNGDGRVDSNDVVLTERDDGQNDDWLFNSDQDDPGGSPWVPPWSDDPISGFPPQPELYYVRINTLARTQAFERNYQGPTVAPLENSDPTDFNDFNARRFRRQLLQTIVDLRNI